MIQSYFALEDLDSKAINELSRQFLINWKASKAKKKLKDERVMTGQITYPFNGERTHRCSEVGPGVRLIGVRFFFAQLCRHCHVVSIQYLCHWKRLTSTSSITVHAFTYRLGVCLGFV